MHHATTLFAAIIIWGAAACPPELQAESLYTGPEALKMLGAEARAEIYQIFPQLRDAPPHYAPKPARPILSQEDSKSLIF